MMTWIILGGLVCIFCILLYLLHSNSQTKLKVEVENKHQAWVELSAVQSRLATIEEAYAITSRELERERVRRGDLEKERERILAAVREKEIRLESQSAEMEAIRRESRIEFQNIANKILEDKSTRFALMNQKNLDQILTPLQEKIHTFEQKVDQTYKQESAERNTLKGVVEQLMQQSMEMRTETTNLTRALKGDMKKQGNWGEVILEKVLERSGLIKDREYRLQVSIQDENGRRQQPDAIIDLPDDKHLVVDSKVSLVAYERWISAETEEERVLASKQHVLSVENHVKDLAAKNYHQLYAINSPDFVLLFMPIESALSLAVTKKPELFGEAWDRKVVIVSPSTLLATLRTIASIWKQELQNRNVLEIANEAGKLYDKFVGFLKDMEQVQGLLDRASQKQEDASRKLSSGPGNIIRRIENLKDLGAKANKQIDNKYLKS